VLDPTFSFISELTMPNKQNNNTAASQHIIPIYIVHTMEKPFCTNPLCACHQNQTQILLLLLALEQDEMTLREASDFVDGKTL